MKRLVVMFVAGVMLLSLPSSCLAGFTVYSGFDGGVNSTGARPNSNSAALAFQAASVGLATINFENMSVGGIPNGTLFNVNGVGGVNLGVSGSSSTYPRISTTDSSITGFNTTIGGSRFLQNSGDNDLLFSFNSGISAFGGYFTGVGTASGDILIEFNDGTSQQIDVSTYIGTANGGVGFLGFTVNGPALLSSVRINSFTGGDVWGIDDVQFGRAAAVPEPLSFFVWSAGALGFAAARRSRLFPKS